MVRGCDHVDMVQMCKNVRICDDVTSATETVILFGRLAGGKNIERSGGREEY